MSEDTNRDNNQTPPTNNQSSSPEEERKKQFERMKEKFGRQNSLGGNKGGNGGNNFYWIYGIVIAVLLFIVFYGNDFNSRLKEVPQSKFFQDMLVKGDVTDVVIVNKTIARITVNPDSVATLDRYKDPKTGRAMFDRNYKGPQFLNRLAAEFLRDGPKLLPAS